MSVTKRKFILFCWTTTPGFPPFQLELANFNWVAD